MSVKILAYFLPQFHIIPENNEWWGEGFTEWTTIKKENIVSKNLLPLNENYYNLLDEKTVLWQTELAEQYGIYGFAYYHYYFKGKKLLEKPAENLLENKNINQRFCFCWANHDWIRSWEGNKTILVKQEYGNEEDWKNHFNYLLPFFKDSRYIKIDNKPLFIIFKDFDEKEALYEYFNKLACENGFNGIFVIFSITNIKKSSLNKYTNTSDAIVIREPDSSFFYFHSLQRRINNFNIPYKIKSINGNFLTKITVKNSKLFCKYFNKSKKKYFLGAYSGWDNTPRHGKRGYRMSPISDKNYIRYLLKLKNICIKNNIEYIFFNAWNEWAESMILEPDTINNYRFLEGIKQVFGTAN